jgi:hypothetical protein
LNDFHNLTVDAITKLGGMGLLQNVYSNSLLQALQDIYPSHEWYPWKFSQNMKAGYWQSKENQKGFLHWLGKQLGFKNMDDWYNIKAKQIVERGGNGLLDRYGYSPSKLVTLVYDDYSWNHAKFHTKGRRPKSIVYNSSINEIK